MQRPVPLRPSVAGLCGWPLSSAIENQVAVDGSSSLSMTILTPVNYVGLLAVPVIGAWCANLGSSQNEAIQLFLLYSSRLAFLLSAAIAAPHRLTAPSMSYVRAAIIAFILVSAYIGRVRWIQTMAVPLPERIIKRFIGVAIIPMMTFGSFVMVWRSRGAHWWFYTRAVFSFNGAFRLTGVLLLAFLVPDVSVYPPGNLSFQASIILNGFDLLVATIFTWKMRMRISRIAGVAARLERLEDSLTALLDENDQLHQKLVQTRAQQMAECRVDLGYCEMAMEQQRVQHEATVSHTPLRIAASGPAPFTYQQLSRLMGEDPVWEALESIDSTDFTPPSSHQPGSQLIFTTSAMVCTSTQLPAPCEDSCGVVRFSSGPPDEHGQHSLVPKGDPYDTYVMPPLAEVRVIAISPPNEWEVEGHTLACTLYTVGVSFL